MAKLTVSSWLQYAATGSAVLETLEATGSKMTHGAFTAAAGMGEWETTHRRQEVDVLELIAAVDVYLNGERTLPYGSLVNAKTGEPGAGLYRDDFLVLSRAKP